MRKRDVHIVRAHLADGGEQILRLAVAIIGEGILDIIRADAAQVADALGFQLVFVHIDSVLGADAQLREGGEPERGRVGGAHGKGNRRV